MANSAGAGGTTCRWCVGLHAHSSELRHIADSIGEAISAKCRIDTDRQDNADMGKLNLDQLRPGMVLAAHVLDRNNRVLLKAGLELTEKYLTILRQWGITEADIEGIEREEVNTQEVLELDPELLVHAELSYRSLFYHADLSHPFNQELMRLSIHRMVRRTMRGIAP